MSIREVIEELHRESLKISAEAAISLPTTPLQKILETKRAWRRELALLPVAEKLRMLDQMREREIAIRGESSIHRCREMRRS